MGKSSKTSVFRYYANEAYLTINKNLLQLYGPEVAVYLSNLIDKLLYFSSKNLLDGDGGFFLVHKQQMEQTGLKEPRIRKCKEFLRKEGILKTKRIGIPAKEWYYLSSKVFKKKLKKRITRPIDLGRTRDIQTDRTSQRQSSRSNIRNLDIKELEKERKGKNIIPTQFDLFWELYPKKNDKGKALTSWNKICNKIPKDRPTWKEIKKAIKAQIKTERWQDKKFIPHPTTWLNQSRWLDDPKEMGIIDFNKPTNGKTQSTPANGYISEKLNKELTDLGY